MGWFDFGSGSDADPVDPLDVKQDGYTDRELMQFNDDPNINPPFNRFATYRYTLIQKAKDAENPGSGNLSDAGRASVDSITGRDPTANTEGSITQNNTEGQAQQAQPQRNLDRRVRLRPKPGAESYVYGDENGFGLISVLRETNGLVFPTTPTINETHSVSYSQHNPSHSISKFNNYESTDNVQLQVSGDFYASNATEARYILSSIHFLRSITKMDFGVNSETRGTPPPVLLFSGYGNFMYNDIPVIVKNVNFSFEQDIDYVQVPLSGRETQFRQAFTDLTGFYETDTDREDRVWVPNRITISMTLEQQPTPDFLTNEFNLEKFKRGEMLTKGGLI